MAGTCSAPLPLCPTDPPPVSQPPLPGSTWSGSCRVSVESAASLLILISAKKKEEMAQLILITGHSPRQQAHVASTKQHK